MAWDELFRALALVMIIEGLMPALAPQRWRNALLNLAHIEPGTLRVFGAILIASGAIALQFL